ncbi:RHS repeat-associated core domain-containing protein, partial [Nocardia arizonensis]|uniref:RHS repeat-associated core domain-containing protein n=1 Tax=Nocardia arizonensis TaxID=1141647 RepID=UPI000AAAAB3F
DFVLDAAGSLRQRIVKLPGGAVLTKTYGAQGAAAANWSYPNVHGDILFTTDGSGTRTGTIHLYDPYGQNIDPATGAFGDIPIPSTAEGGMDFGWLGQHTVPVEHIASLQALEMGARTYLPILGRFLQTDPVLHGSANDYDYVNGDPVNFLDLSGEAPKGGKDGIDPPGSGKNRGFPKLEGFDYYDIYGNLQPYPVPGKNSEPARINPIEALAAGWPTPTRGGCQEAAAEIQGIIGGTIYHVTSAGAGTQSLGPSSHIFNRDGEWNHHYVVIIEDANGVPIVYDAFTGPEGLPMDAYRAQWKDGYGEYLQFKSVG